jgi:hypothetical protein
LSVFPLPLAAKPAAVLSPAHPAPITTTSTWHGLSTPVQSAFAVLRMNVSNGLAVTAEQVTKRATNTNNREKEMDTMMILVLTNESNSRAANAL